MKFVMIGPKRSGKTVLLAMLQQFLQSHRECGINMVPADDETAQYIAESLKTMSEKSWPGLTTRYQPKKLCWHFGIADAEGEMGKMEMLDAAGEDLAELLRGTDPAIASAEFAELRAHVESADVLLFLLNLSTFQTPDIAIQQREAFLLSQFLTKPEWKSKERIVMVSKADLFAEMLSGSGTVREAIADKFSDVVPLVAVMGLPCDDVPFIAVSSVVTETATEGVHAGKPIPTTPLTPGDLLPLVNHMSEILRGFMVHEVWEKWVAWGREIWQTQRKPIVIAFSVLCLLAWWLHDYCAPQHLEITFATHSPFVGGEAEADRKAGLYREGTDATVTLIVRGENGETAPLEFDGRASWFGFVNPFEAGHADTYSRTLPASIGRVTEITVSHDDEAKIRHDKDHPSRGGWYLEGVTIREKEYGESWHTTVFHCGEWLDNGDAVGDVITHNTPSRTLKPR